MTRRSDSETFITAQYFWWTIGLMGTWIGGLTAYLVFSIQPTQTENSVKIEGLKTALPYISKQIEDTNSSVKDLAKARR